MLHPPNRKRLPIAKKSGRATTATPESQWINPSAERRLDAALGQLSFKQLNHFSGQRLGSRDNEWFGCEEAQLLAGKVQKHAAGFL